MMRKTAIMLCCVCAVCAGAATRDITLGEAIATARAGSVDAAVALNELKTAYWEYRTFRADLLPEVNFEATLPSYRKNYSSYQLEDGTYTFVRNNVLQMAGNLSVQQNIWLTGGTLSLTTSLDYLKQLDGERFNRFMSVPVALTLSQPIFGTNHTKWRRRIEPVRYEEAKASFMSATEQVAMRAVDYFFGLLMAKENLATARQNLSNSEKLYLVAVAKRDMGQISENDLLQLQLNLQKRDLAHVAFGHCHLVVGFELPSPDVAREGVAFECFCKHVVVVHVDARCAFRQYGHKVYIFVEPEERTELEHAGLVVAFGIGQRGACREAAGCGRKK